MGGTSNVVMTLQRSWLLLGYTPPVIAHGGTVSKVDKVNTDLDYQMVIANRGIYSGNSRRVHDVPLTRTLRWTLQVLASMPRIDRSPLGDPPSTLMVTLGYAELIVIVTSTSSLCDTIYLPILPTLRLVIPTEQICFGPHASARHEQKKGVRGRY